MELTDLKRSLEDKLSKEVADVDSSIFPNEKTATSEVRASAHAHIPEGAMVRRNVHEYTENEVRDFLGMKMKKKSEEDKKVDLGISTDQGEKKTAQPKNVFPPAGEIERKRSSEEIENMADNTFLKRLFAQANKVENVKRQVNQDDTKTIESKRQTMEDNTKMLTVKKTNEKKRQVKQDTSKTVKNNEKNEIPKFLTDAIAADEKKREASNNVDKRLMKEFAANKAYQHFDHQEKKTGKICYYLVQVKYNNSFQIAIRNTTSLKGV